MRKWLLYLIILSCVSSVWARGVGVIEATNSDEMYQTERLLTVIGEADSGISAQEMVDLIVGNVTEFAGDVELSDGMTVVVLKCDE